MDQHRSTQEVGTPDLEHVLAAYLQAEEAGEAPRRADLLGKHPGFASELASFLDSRDHVPRLWQGGTGFEAGRCIGDYELLGEIGRGGMGVVFKARQKGTQRLVALKVLLASDFAEPEKLDRFRSEAADLARLNHPNIVQVYHAGEHQGRPYFAMELIPGGSLAQKLNDGVPLPQTEAADLVRTVARAVHYSHQHQLIHRDLKPANILLADTDKQFRPSDATLADSTTTITPKITDFGLAKQLNSGTGWTHTGAILGTPEYMAPEQAAGNTRAIGPATDIHALGAILYRTLTGLPPFRGVNVVEVLDQVRSHDPVSPSHLNDKVHPDLDAICLKCLSKSPIDRYPSAEALADDLDRYRNGRPPQARPRKILGRLVDYVNVSRQISEFAMLGTLHFVIGPAFFIGHLTIFFILLGGGPKILFWLSAYCPYAILFAVFRAVRWTHRPISPAERQL